MTECPVFTVDAFTTVPFRGNPASVCLLDHDLPDETLQAIAAEMNHSETAFVRPSESPSGQPARFSLRWFTPRVEVPLCGHATLASSAVIFHELPNPAAELHYDTKSGVLVARQDGAHIALDFPAEDVHPTPEKPAVLDALGASAPVDTCYARGDRNLLVRLADEVEVRELRPDFARLERARGDEPFLGVIVTARGSGPYDFVSRYFAPWVGIPEDPVTGSAHCALAPYWSRLTGRTEMRAYQASSRGGEMTVRLRGNRVDLVGDAVVVAAGTLRLESTR
jgi:PhzF family phenazine biosynthesis protein